MALPRPLARALAAAPLLAALALAGPAGAAPLLVVDGDSVRSVDDPALPPRAASDLPGVPRARADARPPRAGAARGPTVRRALLRLLRSGAISQADHDRYRAAYDEALRVRGRLSGARRAELAQVVRVLERIAAGELLTVARLPALFLTVERNTAWWRARAFPAAGARVRFGSDPVTFQYYRGHGLQIQPLANFGRANALYNACAGINTRPGTPCRRGALRDLLDRMVALGARRGTFTTWEYYFHFGGGRPPWTSGLSQGTAIQALARASRLLDRPDYASVALAALGAFETRPPVGVAVPSSGGRHYLIYSFNPRLRVLNGFLQAVIGLHDTADVTGDARARALFEAGDRAARAEVPRHDTGAWSLYARGGRESDLGYHRLVRDFLRGLCERVPADVYCGTAERFTRYLHEHPRVDFLGVRGRARVRRTQRVRFRLSKLSRVEIHVTRGRRVVYNRRAVFGYGVRSFRWRPARAGRYRVRIEAADLRNHHTVRRGRIVVRR